MNAQATWQTQFSVETSATVEMIWQIFRDVGTWQHWNAGIESLEIHGPFANGTWFSMKPPGQAALRSCLIEVRGATFTLTHVGMIADSRWQTPLVPTSQCAILATGAIREAPVVRNGAIVVGRVMSASLTFDHRIVSGCRLPCFSRRSGRYWQEAIESGTIAPSSFNT